MLGRGRGGGLIKRGNMSLWWFGEGQPLTVRLSLPGDVIIRVAEYGIRAVQELKHLCVRVLNLFYFDHLMRGNMFMMCNKSCLSHNCQTPFYQITVFTPAPRHLLIFFHGIIFCQGCHSKHNGTNLTSPPPPSSPTSPILFIREPLALNCMLSL